ncbi:MAG: Nif3-like dinuclear metal center hexameric protein [Liquorilactobacillus ghanensis]|uniref:Nif3-like dinuclear metal center hexameric protein n=1 Tax=Liquorilactobacillus ghanensis TaxID=399370 RepID=UPI0039ED0C7B
MTKVAAVVTRFEQFAPKFIAEKGDPVGLQLGSLETDVKKMMVTLDVRPEIVAEAINNDVNFIFAHHPAMFHPVKQFDLAVPQNRMYAELIKHQITVYGAHTNLDNANGGMNDWLAAALNLQQTKPLLPSKELPLQQLAVYVPQAAAATVRQALAAAGAGTIGDYQGCSFSAAGTGRFVPGEKTHPTIGQPLEPTATAEEKLEVIIEPQQAAAVIKALRAAHPYEEPVYYLTPIHGLNAKYGMGRVGTLTKELTVKELAAVCKQVFGLTGVRVVAQDLQQPLKRVAVLGGSGGQFYPAAVKAGADVYLTGDLSYHTAHDILASGMAAIDLGHHVESICKPQLAKLFTAWKQENNWQFPIIQSQIATDPFQFL